LGAIVLYYMFHLDVALNNPILNADGPIWPCLFLVLPLYVLVAGISAWRLGRSLLNGQVHAVEGEAHIRIEYNNEDDQIYVVEIGERRFMVSSQAYDAIELHTIYRVYAVPHSEVILSLERMRAVDPSRGASD
jgi:hypothetical protein